MNRISVTKTIPAPMRALPVALMLLAAFWGTSCVKEDLDDCPPEMRLFIDIDMDIDISGDDSSLGGRVTRSDITEWYTGIDTVSVWIFDRNERFVAQWNGGPYSADKTYEVPVGQLGLGKGKHTFVVWTNLGDGYESNLADPDPADGLHLNDFEMRMNIPRDGVIEGDLRHRHHGILEGIDLTPGAIPSGTRTTILISPDLHKVNFSVGGVAPDDNTYTLTVRDRNSAHSFLGEFVEGRDEYRHLRSMRFPAAAHSATRQTDDERLLSTSLLLMKLGDDSGTRVEVTRQMADGPETLYDVDLVSLIKRVYAFNGQPVDFDHTLEFDVDVAFMPTDGSTGLRIAVTINGWTYIEEITIIN